MNARQMFFTPRQFLLIGGPVLVAVGILGFVGVIGPSAEKSLFGDIWWFDNAENWAHLILGVAGVAAAFVLTPRLQRYLVLVLGIGGIPIGLYSLFMSGLGSANLENPTDTILHLAVGGWALAASLWRPMGQPKASMAEAAHM